MRFSTLALAAAFSELSIAGYVLEDDYMTDFYGNFQFFTGNDPTNGFVKYVDEATARQTNLINASSTKAATWGVDVQNKTPKGRPSIRLESKKSYNEGLIVLDIDHMPFGCGTWPAFWTLGPNWPTGGEIDILEGVNDVTNNAMTLHTGPGCAIGSDTTKFSGQVTTSNCDVAAAGQGKNVGCSIKDTTTKSYGAGLNANRGGVFATQWSADGISIWFFPRGSEPADVLSNNPNPTTWGKPTAMFAGACDIKKKFAAQKIIFDTTFCGDWAGSKDVWGAGSCGKKAATCNDYVQNNPSAFTEAYWTVNHLKVYKSDGNAGPAPPSASTPAKSTMVSVPVPASTIKSPLPSGYPPASSKPIPVASSKPVPPAVPSPALPGKSSQAPGASVLSNATPPAIPSPRIPGSPYQSAEAPAAPLPSTNQTAPGAPSPAPQSSRAGGVPEASRVPQSQGTAPTGKSGMPGWVWPVGGKNGSNGQPAASQPGPAAGQDIAHPSVAPVNAAPAAPEQPGAAPPAVPFVPEPSGPVVGKTVYHTVYVTVPEQPAATPAPPAKMPRMARHFREHRRRASQHNA